MGMITVFTPVYNRACIISDLYQSLKSQTDKRFEWIIVDDGSTDNLAGLVDAWISETTEFSIKYQYTPNGGKHRAVNLGVQLASYEAFFIVDSDDYLTDDAIELIHTWWRSVEGNNQFAGVSGLKGGNRDRALGDGFLSSPYIDATNLERKEYGLLGDKAEVYKTSVLKKYPFPEFPGENFLTEAVVWDKIAFEGLKIRWYNRIIYLCEYREDGLTRQGKNLFQRNPKGWGLFVQQYCQFHYLNTEESLQQYLWYYVALKNILPAEQIRENLGIPLELFERVRELYRNCISETAANIGKKLALYGAGARGKELLDFYQGTDVEICFILDRNQVSVSCEQIDLNAPYPRVDAIIVTPKVGQAEIVSFLRERTANRLISYNEWEKCLGLYKKTKR